MFHFNDVTLLQYLDRDTWTAWSGNIGIASLSKILQYILDSC